MSSFLTKHIGDPKENYIFVFETWDKTGRYDKKGNNSGCRRQQDYFADTSAAAERVFRAGADDCLAESDRFRSAGGSGRYRVVGYEFFGRNQLRKRRNLLVGPNQEDQCQYPGRGLYSLCRY